MFEALFRRLGLSVDWTHTYETIGDRARRAAQRALPAQPRPRRGVRHRGADPVGRRLQDRRRAGRARPTASCRAPTTASASDGPTATTVFIETTRPELLPACVALVAHPDDERYAPLFGTTVTTPLFGVEVPVHAHELADPTKGSGIAMICTFGDTTDVTWWRELDLPVRSIVGRDGRLLPTAPDGVAPEPYAELAGKTVKQAQKRIVELLAESGDLVGRAEGDHPPGEVLREGRPSARDRDQPAVVPAQRRSRRRPARRAVQPRQGARLAPRLHAEPLRELGRRPQRRLADQPAALLRRAVPALVPARRGRRAGVRRAAAAERGRPADRPDERGARRLRRGRSATCPGGFTADPDVMDTWATSLAEPADRRAAGRTTPTCSRGSSRTTCARRPTTSSAPGCSRRSCAATTSTGHCRGPTPRCRAGSSTRTARRWARASATS